VSLKVSVGLSVCASGACEEKAKVKRAYSNPQKNGVSLSLRVRIFSSFTPKKNSVRACAPLEHGFELVRTWSM